MHYDFDYKSYERREGMAVSSCCSSGFNVKHGPYVGSREWVDPNLTVNPHTLGPQHVQGPIAHVYDPYLAPSRLGPGQASGLLSCEARLKSFRV